jgi:hypothetical protein
MNKEGKVETAIRRVVVRLPVLPLSILFKWYSIWD